MTNINLCVFEGIAWKLRFTITGSCMQEQKTCMNQFYIYS